MTAKPIVPTAPNGGPESQFARGAGLAGLADFAFASQTALPDDADFSGTRLSALAAAVNAKNRALDLSDPAQRTLGNYQLIAKLGQGGMGVVFRAREPNLDRDVALKLMAAGSWASPEFVARFRAEAQLAARLHHPNIVPIFEINQVDDLVFFTMALIDGETLRDAIKTRGTFSERDAAELMHTIAEAIAYAHRFNVLHLDLKPANILLDQAGQPQIADFGLSRRLDAALPDAQEISGTPNFMAPEQFDPALAPLSVHTDIYGLGGVLYQMLTGTPAFIADTVPALKEQVLHQPPRSVRALNPKITHDMAAICAKCLQKSPLDRYPDARSLAADLQRLLARREVSVYKLNPIARLWRWAQREPKVAIAVGAIFLALAAGFASTGYQATRAKQAAARAVLAASNARKISSFLTTMLSESDPTRNRGKVPSAVDLLDQARTRIDKNEFADQPLLNAELNLVMAKSYRGQSQIDDCVLLAKRANALVTGALSIDQSPPEEAKLLLAQARLTQADCAIQKSQMDDAIALLGQNLAQFAGDAGLARERMESSVLTARALRLSSRRPAARELLQALLSQATPTEAALKPTWARAQLALGRILDEDGQLDPAIALMQSGIRFLSATDGANAPGVLSAQIELGQMQILKVCDRSACPLEQTTAGFAKINSALAELTRVLGADHIAVAFALTNRGDMYQVTHNDLAALADYQQAAAISEGVSPNSRYALNYHLSAAETLVRLARYEAATLAYQDLAARLPKTEGMNPESLAAYQADLKAGLCGIRKKAPARASNFRTPAKLDGC